MPKGTLIGSLLFHGSPDIIIKHKPVTVEDEEIRISCIETKKDETPSYTTKSMISQQAGQLICYIFQMVVAQMLNNLMAGTVCTAGTGYRLYILRATENCILFKVALSGNPLIISVKLYYGVSCKTAVLCSCKTAVLCMALNDLASATVKNN